MPREMMSPRQAEQEKFFRCGRLNLPLARVLPLFAKSGILRIWAAKLCGVGDAKIWRGSFGIVFRFLPLFRRINFLSFAPIVRRGISIAFRPPCRPRRAVGILKKVSIFLQSLAAPIRLRRLASKTRAKCAGIARPLRAEVRFRPKAPSFRPPVFRFSPTQNILRSRF